MRVSRWMRTDRVASACANQMCVPSKAPPENALGERTDTPGGGHAVVGSTKDAFAATSMYTTCDTYAWGTSHTRAPSKMRPSNASSGSGGATDEGSGTSKNVCSSTASATPIRSTRVASEPAHHTPPCWSYVAPLHRTCVARAKGNFSTAPGGEILQRSIDIGLSGIMYTYPRATTAVCALPLISSYSPEDDSGIPETVFASTSNS
mmetsp:Transcript_2732/g.8490  ORF Transcript_2732/g.8490 Transcript_2732/m.8490 type:complete len:206 (+) Transcript_2732:2-619(+)